MFMNIIYTMWQSGVDAKTVGRIRGDQSPLAYCFYTKKSSLIFSGIERIRRQPPRRTLANIHFLVMLFFVLTRAKSRAKSPIAQKVSLQMEWLVVSHPVLSSPKIFDQ